MSQLDVPIGQKVTFVNVKTDWFRNKISLGSTDQTYIEPVLVSIDEKHFTIDGYDIDGESVELLSTDGDVPSRQLDRPHGRRTWTVQSY